MPSSSKRRRVLPLEQLVLERYKQIDERRGRIEERRRRIEHSETMLEDLWEREKQLWERDKQQETLRNGDPELERRIEQQMNFIAKQRDDVAKVEEEIRLMTVEIIDLNAKITQIELADTSTGDDYYDLIRNLGAPSSLTKAKNWRRAQEQLLFLCHIPREAEPPFPLPLVHRAFANFVDRFHSSRIEFGSQECELVSELCILATKDVNDEKQKMMEFNELIGNYLGVAFIPIVVASSYTIDAPLLFGSYMVYLHEVKKDEGNSLFQAMQHYALLLSELPRDKAKSTFCPCFLVELVGVHIRISGLAFFSKVACQPFTPFMHCYINSYDKADMDSLCRAMLALKKGVSELMEYYNPFPIPPPTVDKRIPYPLQEQQMRYVERIGAKKLLFVVEMEQSGERRLFKFCKRYGKGVGTSWPRSQAIQMWRNSRGLDCC